MQITREAGAFTRQEIFSQPDVWAAALTMLGEHATELRRFWRQAGAQQVVFTGCGSTYYLSVAAAAVLQELTGIPARGVPASEVWLNRAALPARAERTLLIAVSRSGETTETLRACESFRARGLGEILTLSCYPERALAQAGDVNLFFPEAQEESIAQTWAFTTLYLGAVALGALWSGREDVWADLQRTPALVRRLLAEYAEPMAKLGSDLSIDRFYFLGSGVRYGLACEFSLKMKEMTLTHSEPFHFMEFRHGPKSMITPETLVVGLVSTDRRADDMAVVDEMRAMGARTLTIGERDCAVTFGPGLTEVAQSLLYVPVGQMVALARSLAKGLDPDRPTNLDAVVVLDPA